MKRLLEVYLVALALAVNITAVTEAQSSEEPPMRAGISVEMVKADNALPMPEADKANAWIVTLTRSGSVFFGLDQVDFESLAEWMISHPRYREQKLYIKADARTTYADVEKALESARRAGFETPVLLTARIETPAPGLVVPPSGLEVFVGPTPADSLTVRALNSDHGQPILRVNDEQIDSAALPTALRQSLRNQGEKAVLVRADGELAFAQVLRVIDTCRSAGAKVILATPGV